MQALARPQDTALGRLVAAQAPHPRLSGFRLLVSGEEALGSLIALVDAAERTLDLQYYLLHNDNSTRAVLSRVHAAAERGVRVRVLLDDIHTAGEDHNLLELAAHPRIDVRLFNPFPAGRLSLATRLIASLTDIARINQRMHSKMLVADNALAITGGRNLGDPYFVQSPTSNFLDLDVVAAGTIVRELSASFDRFWNHALAYPVESLAAGLPPADERPSLIAAPRPRPPVGSGTLAREIAQRRLALVWVPATLLADLPSKIASDANWNLEETVADGVNGLMRSAQRELVIVSPYYVPGERGVALLRELRSRGVRVRVLTNSLATTDAPVVHVGYRRYREALLREGVELHELEPRLGAVRRGRLQSFGSSRASLHLKAMVVDGRTVLVGSMNMDPRSARLNTEIGLVFRSREIAAQLLELFEEVTEHSSYRLRLGADGRLQWHGESPAGTPQVHRREPDAPWWLRWSVPLMAPLAPEELL
ncbi:phospholipase D family protein [Caldimonas tepidiphila]|uniref:phospholipase D family protein n=1 Tax=Caldimonas tepidiphila TaxID=2315841 RepID=UPI000E5ACB00|nr:phospholipase D family protein [Caldimonas tepidiphila]